MTHDFEAISKRTLKLLQERFGFDLWMITRSEGDNWVVLSTADQGYGINEGTVLEWNDSLCSRMVEGLGPRIAPQVGTIPNYFDAPMGKEINIGAYIGVPITNEDGSLFGTLCAINPAPTTEEIVKLQPIIEMMATLLSSVLVAELKTIDAIRRAERAEAEATRDSLTGLYNRLGWSQLVEKEENRCHRYGHPACVFNIDLDNLKLVNDTQGHAAGDQLIKRAANALVEATRTSDVVARLGGDEFCILGIECNLKSAKVIEKRIRKYLNAAGIQASVGMAMRCPEQGLPMACAEADERMYIEKHFKKQARLAMAA